MGLDRDTSHIAITLSPFTLLKSSQLSSDRYSEPLKVSLAIDHSTSDARALDIDWPTEA